MLTANELRIGNWVQIVGIYKDSFQRAGLITVDAELLLLCEQNKVLLLPIPLTPEILKKCGFDKWKGFKVFEYQLPNEERIVIDQDEVALVGIDAPTDSQVFHCTAKYLHQLQNLFYTLTGEELEIEL